MKWGKEYLADDECVYKDLFRRGAIALLFPDSFQKQFDTLTIQLFGQNMTFIRQ